MREEADHLQLGVVRVMEDAQVFLELHAYEHRVAPALVLKRLLRRHAKADKAIFHDSNHAIQSNTVLHGQKVIVLTEYKHADGPEPRTTVMLDDWC
jgi:hypothetical protein